MIPIQFSHATGFPAESYKYFFKQLAPHPVSYVPVFGMGRYRLRNSWRNMVDELLEDIEIRQKEPVIGIGHSFGAVLTFWAAQKAPEYFEKIILIDPPLLSFRIRLFSAMARSIGIADQVIPIARNAKKRRDEFSSIDEARNFWKPKRLFRSFHPECFEDYVQSSLVPDGSDYTLRIPAALESKMYVYSPIRIGHGKFDMPSYYLYPKKGSVMVGTSFKEQKKRFSGTKFISIEKGGHMFPLEYPHETAALLKELIAE
ncbi:MAG: alpha/beta hydrolase [Bacteroidota bacterium]